MSALDDIRYASRSLLRAPMFTVMVVVTLALGIGANAAVLTVVNAVLIKTLPYANPDRLVSIRFQRPDIQSSDSSAPSPALALWAAQSPAFEVMAAYNVGETSLPSPSGEWSKVPSASVSPNLFAVLGVAGVELGRPFAPEDAVWSAPDVAIVSHAFWRDRLGAAQDLAQVRLPGTHRAVVGVMPDSFQFPDIETPDILVPLVLPEGEVVASVHVIARLRAGASLEGAGSELEQITRAARQAFPSAMETLMQSNARPEVSSLQRHLAGDFRPVLLISLGVAGAILLIACANVAGLLLARITGREHEMAIRIAIGGTPARLARLLLTESVMLATAAGCAALFAVQWSLAALRQALIGTAPHVGTIALDVRVVMWTVFGVLLAACLCAAIPISRVLLHGRRWDWAIGASGVRSSVRHTAGRVLVVAQVSAAVVLLVGALLLLGTLWRLTNTDVGFNSHNLLTLRVRGDAPVWPQPKTTTLDEIVRQVSVLPGIVSVAATTAFPLDGHVVGFSIPVDNQPPPPVDEPGKGVDLVSPGYFHTMGIRLLSGRSFDEHDTSSAPRVAIVNEAFVRLKKLSDASALDRRISLGGGPENATTAIIGVVDDVKDTNPADNARPIVYKPFTQAFPNIGWSGANIVVRTTEDPVGASEPVRQAIRAALPGAFVNDVQPMERRIAKLLAPQRERAVVFGLFGLTAVLLAAVGLYGLLAYIVSQEMREFGIRLAIGASRAHLAGLVLRRGLLSAGTGLAIGLAGARLLTRVLSGMLYGVTAADPATYAAAALIMLTIAALASYAPARRAMRADPLTVLRSD